MHCAIYPPPTESPGWVILLILTGCGVVLGMAAARQHLDGSAGLIILQ